MSTNSETAYSLDAFGAPAAPARVESVAILGPGRVGTVLARGLLDAGFRVAVAGPGPAEQIQLIVEVMAPGAVAAEAADAVAGADVVIVAVPLHKFTSIDPALLAGKIVVDVMNYWEPVDGELSAFAAAPQGTSTLVADHIPDARVAKAFNHIGYHDIETDRRAPGSPDRRALAVAGDDPEAAATAMELVERVGFDALYAGPLSAGRALEAGGAIFGVRLGRDRLRTLLEAAR